MNMENEDAFIVIVGDDFPEADEIKEKSLDKSEMSHKYILETEVNIQHLHDKGIINAESKLKINPVKFGEPSVIEEVNFTSSAIKEEPLDYEIIDTESGLIDGDNEYVTNVKELMQSSSDEIDVTRKSYNKRTKPNTLLQKKSYVKVLMDTYPELREDKELLINSLAAVMKTTKPPPPPLDHYVMNGIMLECVICSHQSQSIPAAGRHYQEKHGTRYLYCFACGVNFRSTTNLYKHEKRCEFADAVTVLKARAIHLGIKGRSRPFLVKFVGKEPKRFSCSQCSAIFSTKFSLIAHEHMHSGVRPYVCPMCPRAYTSSSTLSRHIKKHGNERYICDHCQKSFNVKNALITHMNTHKPLKRFGCSECDKRYAQRYALVLHVNREHRGLPPPCACTLCPKRYPRMSLLRDHMRKEHGMNIMTRKMFFKSLPTLSETKVEQGKVVMRSQVENTCHVTTSGLS